MKGQSVVDTHESKLDAAAIGRDAASSKKGGKSNQKALPVRDGP